MSTLLLLLGILVVAATFVDALWTSLWVGKGAGPLSSRFADMLWRGGFGVMGRRHGALAVLGPVILTATVLLWVVLLWIGWTLIFSVDQQSVLATSDKTPADWVARIYFVGYTIFTLGNGDYTPNGGLWQVATVLMNASGMLLVTLAITYVLSVVGAVVNKRTFASQVTGLGSSAEGFTQSTWSGQDFRGAELVVNNLSTQLATLAEQHLAYPILHYYHASRPEKSSAVAVALFDEALTVLRYGVSEEERPAAAVLSSARAAVKSYLEVLHDAFITPAQDPPPPPNLQALRQSGVPTVDVEEFQQFVRDLRGRRCRLLGLIQHTGRDWPDGQKSG